MVRPGHSFVLGVLILLLGISGCVSPAARIEVAQISNSAIPRELDKVSLPTYVVEPPDILLLEAVNNIRPADAKLRVGDLLLVRLGNPEPLSAGAQLDPNVQPGQLDALEAQFQIEKQVQDKFLDREFMIQPDGKLHLGPVYGSVAVEGLTLDQAREMIIAHLKSYARDEMGNPVGLRDPQVTVSMPNVAGKQPISGEHLVRPDGTISLGIYGSVYVAGMTIEGVKSAVETHLSQHVHDPEINVDVLAYNSKVIYVVTDGGGFGEQVVRLPVTGNETVLDAVSQIDGLSEVSSKRMWVARPAPPGSEVAQVLPVHWSAIVAEGITTTNYQLLPGDRIYIKADKMIASDNFVAKLIAPFERVMGFILLGHGMVRQIEFGHRFRGGNNSNNSTIINNP
jgi:protein involved in polysaccharide export with SLBB domain